MPSLRFYFHCLAIALGVYGALWFVSGDRDPEASNYYHLLKSTRELPLTQWTHVAVKAKVLAVLSEDDGDAHIRLTDGSVEKCLPKYYASGQCIVAEVRPRDRSSVMLPKAGDWIIVQGVSRYDRQHSWSEIHPIDHIEILSK